MNIADLKPGMRGVNVEAKIDNITESRTVNLRAGSTAQVADATISDESGSIETFFMGRSIEMVKQGDKISIENGYTQAFRGDNRSNIGRYGKLKRV